MPLVNYQGCWKCWQDPGQKILKGAPMLKLLIIKIWLGQIMYLSLGKAEAKTLVVCSLGPRAKCPSCPILLTACSTSASFQSPISFVFSAIHLNKFEMPPPLSNVYIPSPTIQIILYKSLMYSTYRFEVLACSSSLLQWASQRFWLTEVPSLKKLRNKIKKLM